MLQCDFPDVPVELIEVESNPELAKKFKVRAIPTLLRVGQDGKEHRIVGNQARETLQSFFGMRHA